MWRCSHKLSSKSPIRGFLKKHCFCHKVADCIVFLSKGQSLNVTASSPSSSSSPLTLSPAQTLTLLCSVTVDNLPSIALEVTWLADGRDLVTMERNGVVVSNGTSRRGDASLERTGPGQFRLGVRGVSTEDGGAYSCRVRAFVEKGGRSSGGGGRWHMAAEKTSSAVSVKVAQISEYLTHLKLYSNTLSAQ